MGFGSLWRIFRFLSLVERARVLALLKKIVIWPLLARDNSEECSNRFGSCVHSGLLWSSHQDETRPARDMFGEKLMKDSREGGGEGRESTQTMTQVSHLWKRGETEESGRKGLRFNGVLRKFWPGLRSWGVLKSKWPVTGILCLVGMGWEYYPHSTQSLDGSSMWKMWPQSEHSKGCRGAGIGAISQLCSPQQICHSPRLHCKHLLLHSGFGENFSMAPISLPSWEDLRGKLVEHIMVPVIAVGLRAIIGIHPLPLLLWILNSQLLLSATTLACVITLPGGIIWIFISKVSGFLTIIYFSDQVALRVC